MRILSFPQLERDFLGTGKVPVCSHSMQLPVEQHILTCLLFVMRTAALDLNRRGRFWFCLFFCLFDYYLFSEPLKIPEIAFLHLIIPHL